MNALTLPRSFSSYLKEKKPVMSLRRVLLISSIIAGQIWFIILFLEPSGTNQYEASYRMLRLSGYIFCIVLPFLLIHGTESWIFKNCNITRRAYHGLLFKILLVLLILSSSYVYKGLIVNGSPLTLPDFFNFALLIGLPYLPLVLPAAVLVHLLTGRLRTLKAADGQQIIIYGRNQNERLKLQESNFLYAEAAQNYVIVHYLENNGLQKMIFRSTLKEIQKQVQVAERVHRSYLVNPGHIHCFDGNSRKRVARLEKVKQDIPVSSSYPV